MTRLIDAYIPWFARIQALAGQAGGETAEIAERVDAWFAAARSAAAGASCPAEHAELAAFAAAAWADERLQSGNWEHAGQWQAHLLQRRHFGVVDAGEGFFRRLSELGPEQQEVREVFAMALLLGMRGRHALDRGDAAWRLARQTQLVQVLGEQAERPTELLIGTHEPEARRRAGRQGWRHWMHAPSGVALAAGVALLLLLFGAYAWLLHQAIRAWFPGS